MSTDPARPTHDNAPWAPPMSDEQFARMRRLVEAPSPIGLEGAMTHGVIEPLFREVALERWGIHRFQGSAGVALDTHPGERGRFTAMIVGHADKIRMQVRSIGEDGKIYVNSDSFLPVTLLGHEIKLFSEDPQRPGRYRVLENGTIEALGAIHFADEKYRSGDQGIKKEQLYLELGLHGENRKKQVEALGVRPGDPILLDRPVRSGFAPDTIYGAYLDNGLGCFTVCETARLIAVRGGLKNLRVLFVVATYEEIGRLGSRVLASEMHPDALIGVDVNHDFKSAPNAGEKRFNPQEMGQGFTLSVGSIASAQLNRVFEETARAEGIPFQRDVVGQDTGTDAMAAALGSIDAAAASIGFPIRNMHTISELGHTGDLLAAIHGLDRGLAAMDGMNDGRGLSRADLQQGHPRLDEAQTMPEPDPSEAEA